MKELLADAGAEALVLLLRAVAAIAFTLFGGFVELSAASTLQAGSVPFGLWKVYVGGLALYAGLYVLGPGVLDALDVPREAGD